MLHRTISLSRCVRLPHHHHRAFAITPLPAPYRVTLDTNPDDCNYSCTMCEQHSVYSTAQAERVAAGVRKRRMRPEIWTRVLDELQPHGLREVIPSTMGEPLMYASFEDLVAAVRAKPGVKLNLTTNGSFFPGKDGRTLSDWAALLLPVLSDVKISWNGATAATQEGIMRGSRYATQVSNLVAWVAARDAFAASGGARSTVTLQLTFMSTNLAEIPDIVRFAVNHNVDRVKGHHLWAHFAELRGHDLRRSKDAAQRWNECVEACRAIVAGSPLPSGKRLELAHFEPLPVAPAGGVVVPTAASARVSDELECPFLGVEAWVNHAGDFAPCCAPDAQRKSLGSFGNVTDPGGLLGIWRSPAYQELVATYKEKPLCGTCTMRKKKVP